MARGHDDQDVAKESLDLHLRPHLEHGAAAAMVRQVQALDVADTEAIAALLDSVAGEQP